MSCTAPSCIKPPLACISKTSIGMFIQGPKQGGVSALSNVAGEPDRFVVSFCGSGTGHLTQAMKAADMLKARGLTLAGVVTDSDAAEKMLDEMVRPLGVPILIIPAIELVDTTKGFMPLVNPPRFFSSLIKAQSYLQKEATTIAAWFEAARAGQIFNMYHLTLARYVQLNPLPPTMKITHMAAQFGLCLLTHEETVGLIEVSSKAVMDVMATIFEASGPTIPIGPQGGDGTLPPIVHLPATLRPGCKRLILCYFLVQTNVKKLDDILAKNPVPDAEVHCFSATPLETTKSQLQSHRKQRALFQDLFAKCTGVIVSAGNETIWEAVCRGVPVLAIPTSGHGEQLLNAAVHARNFPNLVRSRSALAAQDISWLVGFEPTSPAAVAESKALREKVIGLEERGSPLLGGEISSVRRTVSKVVGTRPSRTRTASMPDDTFIEDEVTMV